MSAEDLAHSADGPRRKITLVDFHAEIKAQGVRNGEHAAFVCPMCKTLQSAVSLIRAGAGKSFDDVVMATGTRCVGRFTKAGPWKKDAPPDRGCDWSLYGLFHVHMLEIVTEDGLVHPHFELATPAAAQRLQAWHDEHRESAA